MNEARFHRVPDVARDIGTNRKFLDIEIKRGNLAVTRLGRMIRIADADLRAYLAARRVGADAGVAQTVVGQ